MVVHVCSNRAATMSAACDSPPTRRTTAVCCCSTSSRHHAHKHLHPNAPTRRGDTGTNPTSCTPCTADTDYQPDSGKTVCLSVRTCTTHAVTTTPGTTIANRICQCGFGYMGNVASNPTICTAKRASSKGY